MLNVTNEEVVISGISGRFPESDNIYEFWEALVSGEDLTTSDDRRWPVGFVGLPPRSGNVKNADKFDAQFFEADDVQADSTDPQLRLFYEVVYEAIFDAGIIPTELKESNTAIILGLCNDDTRAITVDHVANESSKVPFYTRNTPAVLSQFFQFTGPAFEIDSACASSFSALFEGVQLMKSGHCDKLVIGGSSLHLLPNTSLMYRNLKLLASDGRSKCLDAAADGYCRAEAVVAILVEKKKDAKRIYASIKDIQTNNDGFTPEGVTFPSYELQKSLMQRVTRKARVDPLTVKYFECHITGTSAGDTTESLSILDAYRSESEMPIMFGCLKSSIGHTEEVSALCAVTKVALIFQQRCIPPNRNYATPYSNISALSTGQIIPVLRKTPFHGELIPINSFGLGGANTHAILEANNKVVTDNSFKIVDHFPRLVNISGRTEDGLNYAMNWIEFNRKDVTKEFLALLNDVSKTPLESGMHYRAFMIFEDKNVVQKIVFKNEERRPLWFVFSGLDSQWKSMLREVASFPIFAKSLRKCAQVLDSVGVNLLHLINNDSIDVKQNIITAVVSIVSIQIALVDMFYYIGLKPDGIIGYSIGEIAAAYADGCLTLDEAVLTSYNVAKCSSECRQEKGAMATVGLSWEQGLSKCPSGVSPACDDSVSGITVSGSEAAVLRFVEKLQRENVFATIINSWEMAYHSPFAAQYIDFLTSSLENVIQNPKLKSNKMISTSNNLEQVHCDATYFASNTASPVMFRKATSKIPQNACIVEVGPSAHLLPILQRDIPNSVTVALMKNDCRGNIENILSAIGHIYCTGNNVNIEKFYPKVEYPVPRETLSLSHLLKWDHSKSHFLAHYTHMSNNRKARDTKSIDLMSDEWSFIEDHCVDGRILFPAAGYLFLVWCQFSVMTTGNNKFSCPVEFKNVMFKRATVLSKSGKCDFVIAINEATGQFTVAHEGSVCTTGYISFAQNSFDYSEVYSKAKKTNVTLKRKEIYREMRIRGYDYGKNFQLLEELCADESYGKVNWTGNWITFLDAILQLSLFASNERLLIVPSSIEYLVCNPQIFFKAIETDNNFNVAFDKNVNQFNTIGVCIKGLKGTPIPRRSDAKMVKLRHQCFTPYNFILKSTMQQQTFVETYFQKCIILLEKLLLKEWHVTSEEENCSFNVDSNNAFSFYKRLILALKENESFQRFFEMLTRADKRTVIFQANFNDMFIVQLKQIMENVTKKLFILEVNETESELKESVIHTVENYFMNCEYYVAETDIKKPSNTSDFNLVIYKDVSTELITDADAFNNENCSKILNSFENVIGEDGFLLFTYRTKLTSLETKIMKLQNLVYPTMLTDDYIFNSIPKCFTLIGKRCDDFGVVSCIFKKICNAKIPYFIKPQYDCYEWVEEIKSVLKEKEHNKIIWLLAKESEFHGIVGLTRCLKKEPEGARFRCFSSDDGIVPEFVLTNDLIMNYFKNKCYGVYILLECTELVKDVKHAHLSIKTKGDLSSFRWLESSHNHFSLTNNESNARLINVYYGALNFKDVLIALGKIPQTAYPPGWFNHGNIGSEYSGIDKNGNRVMGIAKINTIATTVIVEQNDLCWPVPCNWSLEEAATIPVAYITVYYALIIRGKLKKNEKVLIHSGSGGVGQAAIAVCLSMKCEVFASVGSDRKKQFLKNKFPRLQENNFLNSRDASFEEHVLKLTGGKGVDVVLNSLADEKLRASVNCLAEFGRFVEIGKFDIIENTPLDLSLFERNQSFHTICIAHLLEDFASNKNEIDHISELIKNNLANGNIIPLNTTVFDAHEAEKAFSYMASGKHIGKVLIKMREETTQFMPKPMIVSSSPQTYCDPLKVYILFGGLGGLGLEVAIWLSSRGAKKLIITSRKGVNDNYQRYVKNRIESSGVTVKIVKNDASTYEKTKAIFNEALEMGSVGGMFNLGLVLKDALIKDQTPESLKNVCTAKVNTTVYSDHISRKMIPPLDYFACFSSLVAAVGSAGQSNYGFANSVMESICEKRRKDGLHGVAIQYGPVGDTGAFNELVKTNDLVFQGCLPQRIPSFLATLDTCMNSNYAICCSTILAPKRAYWTEEKRTFLKTICHILGVDHASSLDDNMSLVNLGMDSLMVVQVKQAFEREFNLVIATQEVRQLTIKEVKDLSNNNSKKF